MISAQCLTLPYDCDDTTFTTLENLMFIHLRFLMPLVATLLLSGAAYAGRSPFAEGYDRGYPEALRLIDLAYSKPYSAPRGDLAKFIHRAQDDMTSVADRCDAIKRISGYRSNAGTAEAALEDLMDDKNNEVAFVATLGLVALRSFDPDRIVAALLRKLKEGAPVEQVYALRALKNIGGEISSSIRESGEDMKKLCAALQGDQDRSDCQRFIPVD